MTESNQSEFPSLPTQAPLGLATGQPQLPGTSRSVEQLLDLKRIGITMSPDPDRLEEAWGVLNPASARSRDGRLFLFPRVVAEGNYSRIGMAQVTFDTAGNPTGVERLGLVLEPRESYEYVGPGVGGVEDPRITFVPLLDTYVMSYTAFGPQGARVALAVSKDLYTWERLGLLHFEALDGFGLDRCDNKDCVIFPIPVTDPSGSPAFALLHRPSYPVITENGSTKWLLPAGVTDPRPSIWISYVPVQRARLDLHELTHVGQHHLLAQPIGDWEHHHIGSGAPPILSEEGWMLYYHGVVGETSSGIDAEPGGMVYRSGVMLLDRDDPRRVLFRSFKPVLAPQGAAEQHGIVSDVVFPTAVDVRGQRIDVYYGAADQRIAAATTHITSSVLLAPSAPPSSSEHQHLAVPAGATRAKSRTSEPQRAVRERTTEERRAIRKGHATMHVKDVMSQAVEVIGCEATLAAVAERMRTADIGLLPVQDDHTVIGVISDRDVAMRGVAAGLDPKTTPVSQIMTRDVVFCYDDQTVEDAAEIMADRQIRRLLVFDRALRLGGIISVDDVARSADNPVLAGETLQQTAGRSDQMRGTYRRILIALDGSPLAERVLSSTVPLAQKFQSTITLLRAVTPVRVPESAGVGIGSVQAGEPANAVAIAEDLRRSSAEYLQDVASRLEHEGLRVESECIEGPASDVILRRARQLKVDLIAITTHGRTGVDRLMLGSVAEDVIRRTPCPVHLVRVKGGN